MALNKNQTEYLSNHYSRTFDMWGQNFYFKNIWKSMEMTIYRLICNHKSGIKFIENKNNRFICEIPLKKEHILLEELNKSCYVKVINTRKKAEPLNSIDDDEFFLKVVAYK